MSTVSLAYGFLLGEFVTILRLVWGPLLLGSGASYLFGGQAIDAMVAAGVNGDAGRGAEYAPIQFLIMIIGFVTGLMASVVLLQVVIFGDRKPGLYVYLWLGAAELRLVLVTLLLVVAVAAGTAVSAVVFGTLGALAIAIPVVSVVFFFAAIAFAGGVIWAALRLSLIWPVVVAEGNLGVERSWQITPGNALRLLGVFVLTFGPYFLMTLMVFFGVMGSDMPAFPTLPGVGDAGAAPDAAASKLAAEAFAKSVEQWQLDLLKGMRLHWLTFSILGFAGNLVWTALSAGALGSAYLALSGEKRD
ncbi:MAG: hypothetical protein K8S25_02635 [Alphaproteobacteria bacterium]|nr:hypothetical protein [Alphaproteobacteria bacterium]